jgi:hypothetical protein
MMIFNKKLLTLLLSAVVVISAGSFVAYDAYADSLSKQEIQPKTG